MSYNAYYTDNPNLRGHDVLEEDIATGNFNPNDLDKQLLEADEEVLHGLNTKVKTKRSFFSRSFVGKHGRGITSSKSKIKKVGYTDSKRSMIHSNMKGGRINNSGYIHLSMHGQSQNSDDESDSDYPSDIEIDIRARPRQSEIGRRAKRLYSALLVFLSLFGIYLFYNNLLFDTSRHHRNRLLYFNGTHEFRPTTIVVSLNGFHPHYVSDHATPYLHELMTRNGGAPYIKPSFPSSTFPNQWTMVTGLYPSNHGIVGNSFYDTNLKQSYMYSDPSQRSNSKFWGGHPIWETASLQGISSYINMWPGCDLEWPLKAPVRVEKYNKSEPLSLKSEKIWSSIDRTIDDRPELIMTFVPTMEIASQLHGINGDSMLKELKAVDSLVGSFLQGLESRNLTDIVNLVVVSDHGMAPTSNDRLIYLDDLVEMDNVDHVGGWPLVGLYPKPSINLNEFYKNLKEAQSQFGEGKWDVFLRQNLPKEWKFGGSKYNKYKNRIAPLWLIPKVGWTFTNKDQMAEMNNDYKPQGISGYNNSEVLMRGIFLAKGPYFSNKFYLPFENTGIYNILCDTLGIQPVKNDAPKIDKILTALPTNWIDVTEYPDLPFQANILSLNSTYNSLFRKSKPEVTAEDGSNYQDSSVPTAPSSNSDPAATGTTRDATNETAINEGLRIFEKWYNYSKVKTSDAKLWVKDKYNSLTNKSKDTSK